jgi:hypothetical protein
MSLILESVTQLGKEVYDSVVPQPLGLAIWLHLENVGWQTVKRCYSAGW